MALSNFYKIKRVSRHFAVALLPLTISHSPVYGLVNLSKRCEAQNWARDGEPGTCPCGKSSERLLTTKRMPSGAGRHCDPQRPTSLIIPQHAVATPHPFYRPVAAGRHAVNLIRSGRGTCVVGTVSREVTSSQSACICRPGKSCTHLSLSVKVQVFCHNPEMLQIFPYHSGHLVKYGVTKLAQTILCTDIFLCKMFAVAAPKLISNIQVVCLTLIFQ